MRRNPRFRKTANRLIPVVTVLTAFFATLDSLPASGKSWRPLLVAQIVTAWLVVAVSLWTWRRGNRKSAAPPLIDGIKAQL